MESFLQKISLQNLLRQFFCGVVFFVPLWLFSKKAGFECGIGSLVNISKWEMGNFLNFAALTAIVGTIIYHLEKNLYSYFTQSILEFIHRHNAGQVALAFFLIILCFLYCLFNAEMMLFLVAFMIILSIWLIFFQNWSKTVINRTQQCWIVENYTQKYPGNASCLDQKQMVSFLQAQCIAAKVSTWSDFIHCVQSCCFAWWGGCMLCEYIFSSTVFATCKKDIEFSINIVTFLLVLEFLFDWHRYKHVIAMTDGNFSIPATFPNQSK